MKKPWIWVGLVIVAAIVVAIVATRQGKPSGEIRIGAVLPLTGELAVYGQKMKKGIDLAVSQVNEAGGINRKKLRVLYEDDQGDGKSSVAAVQKLIVSDGVQVIIGGATGSTAIPSVEVADRNKVVLFSPSATSPKLSGVSRYFFRNWPPDTYDGTEMGVFAARSLKLSKVAVLYVNNEWGVAVSSLFSEAFRKAGGEILLSESYDQDATDFRTQLTKIAARNPEAIYIPGYLKGLINILRQKQELGINARVLSAYGFYDPQILKEVPDAAEGAVFTAPSYDADSGKAQIREYVLAFEKAYGEKPDIWSAQAYDAANIIMFALQKGAMTGTEIRNIIARITDYQGVSGTTSFDENGDVHKPLRFMSVKQGKFIDFPAKYDNEPPQE